MFEDRRGVLIKRPKFNFRISIVCQLQVFRNGASSLPICGLVQIMHVHPNGGGPPNSPRKV